MPEAPVELKLFFKQDDNDVATITANIDKPSPVHTVTVPDGAGKIRKRSAII
jgi:hypothetical protein